MARTAAPHSTQAEPTRPRPTDPDGRQLDAHGLPIGGPARAAALAGKPDPALTDAAPAVPTDHPTEEK